MTGSLALAALAGSAALPGFQPALAGEEVDVGLIGPFTGRHQKIGPRVQEALLSNEKDPDTGKSYFHEFDGKDLVLQSLDSESDDRMARQHAERFVSRDEVEYVVSGDVVTSAVKAVTNYCKDQKVDCIVACNRMKLDKSNPHPFNFQILPDFVRQYRQLFQFMSGNGLLPDSEFIFIVPSVGGEPWRGAMPAILEGTSNLKPTFLEYNRFDLSSLGTELRARTNRKTSLPIVFTPDFSEQSYYQGLGPFFSNLQNPVVMDTYLNDPANQLSELLSDNPSNNYFLSTYSRLGEQTDAQEVFGKMMRKAYDRDLDPLDILGGAALQLLGRALAGTPMNEVKYDQKEAVCGFAVSFDDQGANVAGTIPIFQATGDGLIKRQ